MKNMRSMRKFILRIILLGVIVSWGTSIVFDKWIIPGLLSNKESEVRLAVDINTFEKGQVAIADQLIDQYTMITEQNIDRLIKIESRPMIYCNSDVISYKADLIGMVISIPLESGSVIYNGMLKDSEQWFDNDHREIEISVKNLVADSVNGGNLIDVLLDYGNGLKDIVLSKVRVNKIISPYVETYFLEDGSIKEQVTLNPAQRNEGAKPFIITIYVDGNQHELVSLAEKLGAFETVKYIDDQQEPRAVTFTKEKGLKVLSCVNEGQRVESLIDIILKSPKDEPNGIECGNEVGGGR